MNEKKSLQKHTSIRARVDETTRIRFRAVARQSGKTESELLREIIASAIALQSQGEAKPVLPDCCNTHTRKLTIRLPAFLLDAVRERGKAHGMAASRWIASLIQSTLMEIPVMTAIELQALENCSAELSAIGRNLNQAVRILNADPRAGSNLKLELLHAILSSLSQAQQTIRTLVRASNRRWKQP